MALLGSFILSSTHYSLAIITQSIETQVCPTHNGKFNAIHTFVN